MLKLSNLALIASGLLIVLGLFLLYRELSKGNSISNTKIIDLVLKNTNQVIIFKYFSLLNIFSFQHSKLFSVRSSF